MSDYITPYISGRQQNLKIGVSSYTDNKTALEVIGSAYISGNLGIGTTNPTSKLHVVGGANITGIITTTSIKFSSGAVLGDTYDDGGFGLRSAPNQYVNLASNNLQQYIEFNDSQIVIGAGFTGDGNYKYWIFEKDGTTQFPGNVGIATATPTQTRLPTAQRVCPAQTERQNRCPP